MNRSELAYRKAAAESACGLGLLTVLFDTLAGDIRRAVETERHNDITERCRELNHALLVIGYLEDRVNKGSGGELSDHLIKFYASLRRSLVVAQAKRSPEMLEQQLSTVLGVRRIWQHLESPSATIPAAVPAEKYAEMIEKVPSSWSA